MHKLRTLTVGLGALALATVAAAQFDGPAPLAWRFLQPTQVAPGGSPLVVGERVYQSIGGRVVCIDKDSGNLRFRFPAIDPIPGTFRTTPVRTPNGTIVAVGDNRIVYAFNEESGDLKWSFNLPGGPFGPPAISGNIVVVAQSDNKLVAINADTGQVASGWENNFNVLDGINGSLTGYRDSVLFFTGRNELVSLNVTTRKYDWRRALTQVPPNAQPVVFGEDVFTVSGGYLVQISAGSGIPRWQVPTGHVVNMAPTVSAAGAMVVSQDGKVLVYDPVTRQAITKKPIELGTLAIARGTAVGDKFVVPTTIGGLILVDPKAGAITWNYLIRPIGDPNATSSTSGGPGRGPGGPGRGPGGGPGGGFPGGPGGGFPGGGQPGGGNQQNNADRVVTIQPSATPVLAGSTLLVPAKDGSILAFDRVSGVDLTGPKVDMLFPNPGDQVSGQPPLLLAFKVEDIASGVKNDSLKVEVGGQALEYDLQRDGLVVVRFSQSGKNRPLQDGRKEIVVTVTDWLGNVTKQSYALTIDNTLTPVRLPGQQDDNNRPGGGGRGGGAGAGDGR